ncbi:MAG: BolA family protein [Halofilum sp. (in: g-proteobacteria)]
MSMKHTIEEKLTTRFEPEWLQVLDESQNHNVPPGAESHFRVTVVSDGFGDQNLLARHRAINATLADELAGQVHALAIHAYTPEEWQARNGTPESPPCLGGGKAERG